MDSILIEIYKEGGFVKEYQLLEDLIDELEYTDDVIMKSYYCKDCGMFIKYHEECSNCVI